MERKAVYQAKKVSLAIIPVLFVQPVVMLLSSRASADSLVFLGLALVYSALFLYLIRRPLFFYSDQGITIVRKYGTDDPDFIPSGDLEEVVLDGRDKINLKLKSGRLVYLYPPKHKAAEIYINLRKISGLEEKK